MLLSDGGDAVVVHDMHASRGYTVGVPGPSRVRRRARALRAFRLDNVDLGVGPHADLPVPGISPTTSQVPGVSAALS